MKLKSILFCTPAFLFFACAHSSIEKSVDKKVSQESDVRTRADLTAESTSLVENAKDLTPEQKAKLNLLRSMTQKKLDENNQESLKMKSVLIQDLVATHYKENEVELIKSKLKDLQSKRLTIMFQAVEEANSILGRQARLNDDVMRDFVRIQHD